MDFIRLGNATDHGGKVISASSTMDYDGRPLARKGDEVSCPKHPDVRPNRIIDGAPVYVLDVAQVDDIGDGATPLAGCEFTPSTSPKPIEPDLLTLRDQLAQLGVQRLGRARARHGGIGRPGPG